MLNKVDFPHPDGPTMETKEPSSTRSEVGASTVVAPKVLPMDSISRSAAHTTPNLPTSTPVARTVPLLPMYRDSYDSFTLSSSPVS